MHVWISHLKILSEFSEFWLQLNTGGFLYAFGYIFRELSDVMGRRTLPSCDDERLMGPYKRPADRHTAHIQNAMSIIEKPRDRHFHSPFGQWEQRHAWEPFGDGSCGSIIHNRVQEKGAGSTELCKVREFGTTYREYRLSHRPKRCRHSALEAERQVGIRDIGEARRRERYARAQHDVAPGRPLKHARAIAEPAVVT